MVDTTEATTSAAAGAATGGLLDQIIDRGKMAREEIQKPHARDLIGEFARQVLDEGMTLDNDLVATCNKRIAQIDAMLSAQLNEIMHHEEHTTEQRHPRQQSSPISAKNDTAPSSIVMYTHFCMN